MRLTQKELDRLHVFTLAQLSRRLYERGVKLNHPESIALICDVIFEEARAGTSFDEVIGMAGSVLTVDDVIPGVAEMIPVVQVDAMFPDGTRLVTVRRPIR